MAWIFASNKYIKKYVIFSKSMPEEDLWDFFTKKA